MTRTETLSFLFNVKFPASDIERAQQRVMLTSVKYTDLPLCLTAAVTHEGMRFNRIVLAV